MMDPTTIANDSLKPSRRSKWTFDVFIIPSTYPESNRKASTAAAKSDATAADDAAATAKASTAIAKTDALAVQTANVATTRCENALAALKGLGEGNYTLAAVAAVLQAIGSGSDCNSDPGRHR